MNRNFLFCLVVLSLFSVLIQSCDKHFFRFNYGKANDFIHSNKDNQSKYFLKAHLKNGDVCILKDTWKVDTVLNQLTGSGTRFDFNRNKIYEGLVLIPLDSVAIFETNAKITDTGESSRILGLTVMAGVNVILGIICISTPKACFGSCPTFYMNEKDDFHHADAEGFSNAICPALEYADIDALHNVPLKGDTFSITMRNEALETHCVNDIRLFACPRKSGEYIYQSVSDSFYRCEQNHQVTKAVAPEGEITDLLRKDDRDERFSLADEKNLATKEEILLDFNACNDIQRAGLVLNFRQTLMTTYFIYSAMGYMGNRVGDVFARMETDSVAREKLFAGSFHKELGNIEVYMLNERQGKWEKQGEFYEAGPIAFNRQILPLRNSSQKSVLKLKLILNKGYWRIDYAGLTDIKGNIKPIELEPENVFNKGTKDAAALNNILDPSKYLISMPGSEYQFQFLIPKENPDYELFLYTRGYYMEWMRDHWLKDKNLPKLKQMVYKPQKYLKEEARNYKRYESSMEQIFWNSRINTKTFSYDK